MFLERMRSQNQSRPARHVNQACASALIACVLSAGLSGCSHAASEPRSPAPAAAPASAQVETRNATAWAFIDGIQLPVRLRIPFASEWQRRETASSLRLQHPLDKSTIVVRLWSASRLVTVEQCLGELALLEPEVALARRTWMSGPLASDTVGQNQDVVAAQGFEPGGDLHGVLRASVHAASNGQEVAGVVIAVAAGVGRCLALVANSSVGGVNAEREIANRLAWLVEGVSKSVALRTVQQRVEAKP
jgi:hypothetical protein